MWPQTLKVMTTKSYLFLQFLMWSMLAHWYLLISKKQSRQTSGHTIIKLQQTFNTLPLNHVTDGLGAPAAMHSNRTLSPATTVMLTGPWVITGAEPAIKHTINANITAHPLRKPPKTNQIMLSMMNCVQSAKLHLLCTKYWALKQWIYCTRYTA